MQTEDRLSDVLSEFARTLVTDFPIQGILDHLVRRIVDILPIDAAGVSLISADHAARSSSPAPTSRRCATSTSRPRSAKGPAWRRTRPTGHLDPRPRPRRPVPEVRRARAGRRVWSRSSPSRCATTTAASAPSTSTARSAGDLDGPRHGGRADAGRRGDGVPAERPGAAGQDRVRRDRQPRAADPDDQHRRLRRAAPGRGGRAADRSSRRSSSRRSVATATG